MSTCGEVLVQLLEGYGIEVAFGIPGTHTIELYRGLPATRIRHVTPRHEPVSYTHLRAHETRYTISYSDYCV